MPPAKWNLLDNNVASINNKHLERICEYLNCEPNDLYEWRPDADILNTENHPVKALRRDENAPNYGEIIRELPLDKIDQIKEILSALKNEEQKARSERPGQDIGEFRD